MATSKKAKSHSRRRFLVTGSATCVSPGEPCVKDEALSSTSLTSITGDQAPDAPTPTNDESGDAPPPTAGSNSAGVPDAPLDDDDDDDDDQDYSDEEEDEDADLKECGDEIKKVYGGGVEGKFKIGDLLNNAAEKFKGRYTRMIYQGFVPFGEANARKYRAIADNKFLRDRSRVNACDLPDSLSTLYELALLPDDILADMYKDKKLHAEVKREDAQEIRQKVEQQQHYIWDEFGEAVALLKRMQTERGVDPVAEHITNTKRGHDLIAWRMFPDLATFLQDIHDKCAENQKKLDEAWGDGGKWMREQQDKDAPRKRRRVRSRKGFHSGRRTRFR